MSEIFPHRLYKDVEDVRKWVTYNAKTCHFYLTKNKKMAKVFRFTCPENNIKHFADEKNMKGLQYETATNNNGFASYRRLSDSER